MPLEHLQGKIRETTRALMAGHQLQVARIFHVVISPGLEMLPEWYAEWFPEQDELLTRVHPWMILPPGSAADQALINRVTETCMAAFDVGAINELIGKGYQLRGNHNQVILIADATDPDALHRLRAVRDAFESVTTTLLNQAHPFFFSAILLLKKMVRAGPQIEIRQTNNEEELQQWLNQEVDRTFLIDLNNAGYSIQENLDLLFLVGQLIHFLAQFAVQDSMDQFGEWMRRGGAHDGQCAGLSAASLSVPIDQILEKLLVIKGANLLDARLLGGYDEKILANHLLVWHNRTHSHSLEALTDHLLMDCDPPLLGSFGNENGTLPEIWSIENSAKVMQEVDLADAAMPARLAENERILAAFCETRELDYGYDLAAFIDAIIATSRGGFGLAEAFLLSLREQIEEMIPEEIEQPRYLDVAPFLADLRKKVDNGPRLAPLLLRAGMFALPGLTAALLGFQWLYAAAALLCPLAPLVQWHAFNTVVDRKVVRLWEAFSNKWQACLQNIGLHKASDLLNSYLKIIDEQLDRLGKARQRSETLITLFRESAARPIRDASAFWHYIMHTPEDYAEESAQLETDAPGIEARFMNQVKLENLVDRLALAGTEPPSDAEWQLLEEAAILYLPYVAHLVDRNIMELLLGKAEKFKAFFTILQQTASPFLQLLPGETAMNFTGYWEVPGNLPESLRKGLANATNGITPSTCLISGNPFRIAFYTLVDGVPMRNVRWRS